MERRALLHLEWKERRLERKVKKEKKTRGAGEDRARKKKPAKKGREAPEGREERKKATTAAAAEGGYDGVGCEGAWSLYRYGGGP